VSAGDFKPMQILMNMRIPLLLLLASHCLAGEVEETARLAPKYKARTEVRLWDGTRADLVSDTHAIEVDWSHKWAEAIGQSLYYSSVTGKKPGIVLLVKDIGKEERFIYRCQTVCARCEITLWLEQVSE